MSHASGTPATSTPCVADGQAVLVDFGSGAILDHLDEIGVERVTDVLVTHHHRDQVQGLARAAEAGIRIWVPPLEAPLIAGASTSLAAAAARERLRPSPGQVLADRLGRGHGRRRRVPDRALRRVRGLHPADARPHRGLGHVPARGGRPPARVQRRPRLRGRQDLVARGDAVVVQRRRRPRGDARLVRDPRRARARRAAPVARAGDRGPAGVARGGCASESASSSASGSRSRGTWTTWSRGRGRR